MKIEIKSGRNQDLQRQNGGDAKAEGLVQGLVVPRLHAQQRADAAAEQGGADQGALGDAPAVFPGFSLFRKHK